MARPLRIEYEDAFYHVIQRGIERKNIFVQDSDKNKFLSYLQQAYTGYSAIIHTYILMNNHYHIIIQTPRANLSKIMHFLNTSYAAYFNAARKRVGPLYQGRYKAILVEQDEYLHHLSRYIHLNPIRINIAKDPIEYSWSSYKYFVSGQTPPRWLDTKFILSMFDKATSKAKNLYKQFVLDGIGEEKKVITENMLLGFVLGSPEFLKTIENLINKKKDYEIPELDRLRHRNEPTLEDISQLVAKQIIGNIKLQRKLSIYLSRKYTQKTLKQIAEFYGKIKYTAISQIVKRAERRRREDKGLDKLVKSIEACINV